MMVSVHPGGDSANAARSILLILRFLIVATNTSGTNTNTNTSGRPQNIKPQSKFFSPIKKTQTIKWVKIDPDANN